ncbi:hypothetical protein GQ457_01G037230 [Hibiscus cannabinus]
MFRDGATRPKPSLETRGPRPGLERAGQNQDPMQPTRLAEPESNHLNAPTWVTSRSYSLGETSVSGLCI